MIKFSIIVPTYNRRHMINDAIDSVLNQQYKNWELIIIDDGSTDKTSELINEYKDDRIKYYYQQNKGKGPARNKGIKLATGDYVCFLDSDDSYTQNHLSCFYSGINLSPQYIIYRTGAIIKDYNGTIAFQSKSLIKEDLSYQIKFIWKEYFGLLDLCIKKDLASSVYLPIFNSWEDKHYIIQLVLNNAPIKQLDSRTIIINDHEARGIKIDLINNKNAMSDPLRSMDNLFEIAPCIRDYISPSFLKKSKITLRFVQIINLIKLKQFRLAFSYYVKTIINYPHLINFRKTIGLIYYVILK